MSDYPLFDKYPHMLSYLYCIGNSVRFIDNDGRKIVFASGSPDAFKQKFNIATKYLKDNGLGDLYGYLQQVSSLQTGI